MKFELVSESELKQMQDATLHLLSEVGITTTSEKFIKVLLDNGCKEENGRIFFPIPLIEKALSTVPEKWSITGRGGDRVVVQTKPMHRSVWGCPP